MEGKQNYGSLFKKHAGDENCQYNGIQGGI